MSIQRIGQIVGNFKAGEEILSSIRLKTNNKSLESIQHLGINCRTGEKVFINEKLFEIGKTGILELQDDVNISSIKFQKDTYAEIDFSYI